MSPWLAATIALVVLLAPAGIGLLRGRLLDRLVALQLLQVIAILGVVTFAVAAGRPSYIDVALILAILSFAGTLVFVRVVERWL